MDYEWDAGKQAANLRKHGVGFSAAIEALRDPHGLEAVDEWFAYGEERVQTIGMARNGLLFVVTIAPEEHRCRIISARKATRHEQDRYYARDRPSR